jgi:uncharacterized membrane protein YdjX (TVP38/TMEM64 family)
VRILLLFAVLATLVIVPFLLWGGSMESVTVASAAAWLRGYGRWAWAAGIVLLVADLFLPVPATVVFSALGFLYGTVLGGIIGAAGSILSGLAAYVLCRAFGRGAARRITGERDLARAERLFSSLGGWLVALSRWTPVFPEVIACMAGLARMPPAAFLAALCAGSVPLAVVFAAVGAAGVERPGLALALSAALPAVLWPAVSLAVMRRAKR